MFSANFYFLLEQAISWLVQSQWGLWFCAILLSVSQVPTQYQTRACFMDTWDWLNDMVFTLKIDPLTWTFTFHYCSSNNEASGPISVKVKFLQWDIKGKWQKKCKLLHNKHEKMLKFLFINNPIYNNEIILSYCQKLRDLWNLTFVSLRGKGHSHT